MNLILGGTHGLGGAIASELRAKGEETFVTGRSYIESEHGPGMVVNLAYEDQIDNLVGNIQGVDGLAVKRFFWVSGYGYNGDFSKQPDPQEMADVNFAHVMPIARAVWNKMLSEGDKTNFVVVSSSTGVKARDNEAVYAATKHAQVGFARSLGLESERLDANIRVALFLPGGMQTRFWEGKEPASFHEFLDPAKVAAKIVESVASQQDYFYEEAIERGSL